MPAFSTTKLLAKTLTIPPPRRRALIVSNRYHRREGIGSKTLSGQVYDLHVPYLLLLHYYYFFHLTYSRWTSSLPSCLWSQRIFPSLPGSRLTIFLSRCKFGTLTTRQPMVEFYLLTFPRFPLGKKEHKSYLGKNRTHAFRTSRCAAYLQDHSGDELHIGGYKTRTTIGMNCRDRRCTGWLGARRDDT